MKNNVLTEDLGKNYFASFGIISSQFASHILKGKDQSSAFLLTSPKKSKTVLFRSRRKFVIKEGLLTKKRSD
jgi:hypothetical protein